MKNIKKSTWIAIGCVALAILASQMYNAMQEENEIQDEVSVVSEIYPTAEPTPTPTETPVSALPSQEPPLAEVAASVNTAAEPSPSPSPFTFILPAAGEVQRPYSDTELIYFEPLQEWRCHLGIDFLPSENDAVLATAAGTVERVYEDHLYGTTVAVDHGNGLKSLYSSLAAASVDAGNAITAGSEIGRMGETAAAETGVHLHFSMERDGKAIDPFNIQP